MHEAYIKHIGTSLCNYRVFSRRCMLRDMERVGGACAVRWVLVSHSFSLLNRDVIVWGRGYYFSSRFAGMIDLRSFM